MILLRSTHERILKAERDAAQVVVASYEARIQDLRSLVFTSEPTRLETLPIRTVNAILDGVEVLPNENESLEKDMAEANRIFSGAYDAVEETW